jgi:VanZ family protein
VDAVLWLMAVGCLFLVAMFSLVDSPPGGTPFPNADKVEHAFAYFATTLLFLLAGVWRPGRGAGRLAWALPWIVGGAVAMGELVEIAQAFTETRRPDVLDWAADSAGVLVALLVIGALQRGFAERR